MSLYWSLYTAFFRIGLLTFGGGYAMLPMLQREVVDRHGWATEDALLDCYAIAQCTPGVIAVNTATFVGYKQKGVLGGLAATLGVVTPSLLIISLLATVLGAVSELPTVAHAFAGIRVAVAVLVLSSLIRLYRSGVKGALANGVFIASLIVMILFPVSPVWIVVIAVLLGILLKGRGTAV
ncbi:MAG: chromate transporter [Oscillospiraceae bacterium]|nr:chromate transporter [Oscillospiraceae bacterium]